jgi:cell division protein ZapB
MERELHEFEQRLGQLLELCGRLRTENQRLREELASSLDEARRRREQIESARTRLEQLIEQIPDQSP